MNILEKFRNAFGYVSEPIGTFDKQPLKIINFGNRNNPLTLSKTKNE